MIEDPRNGAIAPDAHLTIITLPDGNPLPAETEHFDLFHCLQATGDECNGGGFNGAITTYGFGTAATCPCGNAGSSSTGCANSTGQGGRLTASGNARISTDSVVLAGSQMPDAPALYYQGTATDNAVFGDGLRVVGGSVVRLGTRNNVNGASTMPSLGSPHLSTIGGVEPGENRYYQVWYRNAASFCSSSTFNLTNGVKITWGI